MLNILQSEIREPASCVIKVEDSELNDLYPLLMEVNAVLNRRSAAEATLIFETRRTEEGKWQVHDDNRIKPWKKIKILATFGSHEDEVFQGFIRQVKVEFPEQKGATKVTVTCQDTSLLMDRTQNNVRWGDDARVSDGDIVTQILNSPQNSSINFLDTPSEGMRDLVVQQNETDIQFLSKRAQENAYDLFFREGKLYFGEPRYNRSAQPTIMVYAGIHTSCIRFNLNDDGHHPDAVIYEIANDDDDTTTPVTVTPNLQSLGTEQLNQSTSTNGEFAWRLSREGNSSENQMQQRAQARVNEESNKIKANGELDGAIYGNVLLPGEPVGIDGVGERYGGIWYVTKVEHRFDINGYRQSFEVLRNAYGDNLPASNDPLQRVR